MQMKGKSFLKEIRSIFTNIKVVGNDEDNSGMIAQIVDTALVCGYLRF